MIKKHKRHISLVCSLYVHEVFSCYAAVSCQYVSILLPQYILMFSFLLDACMCLGGFTCDSMQAHKWRKGTTYRSQFFPSTV